MVTSTGNAPEKKISSAFIYFFGSFGGILFGYDIGVMTGACRSCRTIGTCRAMRHHRLDHIGRHVRRYLWRRTRRSAL